MKMIKIAFRLFLLFAFHVSVIACDDFYINHSRLYPLFFNAEAGIRFGYLDNKVKFVDCVQIEDEMTYNSVWFGEYIFSNETLPIQEFRNENLVMGRSYYTLTNQFENENACKFDSCGQRRYNTSVNHNLFAIRAKYNGVVPEGIHLTFYFPNIDTINSINISKFFSVFTYCQKSLFLWWLVDNEDEVKNDNYDKELVDVLESSVIYSRSISIYLWDDYDPINDEIDSHKEYKQKIYKYWQDDHYFYDGSGGNDYYTSVLGPSFDEPYPFIEDAGDVSSL